MPFDNPQPIWTRHELLDGQCTRCGLAVPGLPDGPLWIKLNARVVCEPMGRQEECAA